MDTAATGALKAYADALKRTQAIEPGAAGESAASQGGSFADMVKDVISDTVATTKKSEDASMQALAGQGDPVDVVTAMTNAEATLQTVVAVRDKIISAYQEIMRMPM
jgi:flagellar hook-basal body complex protein FliE